ncbi:MAG: hypothetical protein F4Z33_03775 [Gemmatimonadales bacterium]|nr:hypothetical protein [Gemmatimonadales bacterium]MXX78102.1 hypothetical protein [Gemmatimonadales bacterium]MYC87033.1 hypothetical protein [Candidatus Palauibacter denitrificans]
MTSRWRRFAAATTLSFAAVLTSCGPSPAIRAIPLEAPLLLRMAPPEGQVSRYAFSMETSIESPMMPSTADPLATMAWQQVQTVLSADDGVFRIRGAVDSASTTLDFGMPMPGMDDLLPDLSGVSFTVDMDPRGSVLRVVESEGIPEGAGVSVESMLQGAGHSVLPEAEVSPGDSWMVETPIEMPMGTGGTMSLDMEFTYTFVSLADGLATLSFEGPMDMDMDMQGMAMTGSGTLSGTLVVDLVEGRYVSQTSRQNMEMGVAGTSMTVNTTTTLELMPDS